MGGKGPRRRLGPEERALWERVAASARPLRPDRPLEGRTDERQAGKRSSIRQAAHSTLPGHDAPLRNAGTMLLRPIDVAAGNARVRDATTFSLAPPEAGPVGRAEAGLDRRTAERLRKGARAPDARIDLHGMTAERAHHACLRFLGEAVGRGHRVVLVITGKGGRGDRDGPRPGRGRGVLRDSLPGWLRASPLGQSIVGIYQAHRRHGGEGAFYVYLKRHR